ncbi:MAG TPA: hypothetical protein PKI01_02225 [Bacteroidales bacterium]|nr:hypothetical protein [Bacteroidales bacterium]
MKKIGLISLVILITVSACKTSQTSKSGDAEKKFVSTFLTYMDHEKGPLRDEMMACISPTYIKDNGINTKTMKVNNYSIWGFNIDYYVAADGMVVTKVWGEEKKWIHQLEFKVVKEKGQLYLMPSRHSDAYIDPWFAAKTYVKE